MSAVDFATAAWPAVGAYIQSVGPEGGEDAAAQLRVDRRGGPVPWDGETEISRWILGWVDSKPRAALVRQDGDDLLTVLEGEIGLVITRTALLFSLLKGTASGLPRVNSRVATVTFRWPLSEVKTVAWDRQRATVGGEDGCPSALIARCASVAGADWVAKGWLGREQPRKLAQEIATVAGVEARQAVFLR